MDLDHFRELNTKLGSMEGNRVLSEFGKMLKNVFRGGDLIFRQGGDEFLVVMPDTSEQQAEPPLQRLLRAVDQWNRVKRQYVSTVVYLGHGCLRDRHQPGRNSADGGPKAVPEDA